MEINPTQYPPTLSEDEDKALAGTIADWALANGLAVRPQPALLAAATNADAYADADVRHVVSTSAPVTLFPSPFPRDCFMQAKSVQKAYNALYSAVSRDEDFISQIVKDVTEGDDFTLNLWKVHQRVKTEGYTQPLSLGLFRSDYMIHETANSAAISSKETGTTRPVRQVRQVEFNTIASSFGGLSSCVSRLHSYLAGTEYPRLKRPIVAGELQLPENDPAVGLADGIWSAYEAYGKSELGLGRCVLFLVQDGERNVFDQRHLEYALGSGRRPSGVAVFRLAFGDILKRTTVAATGRRQLLYRPPTNLDVQYEVAVVYFRSGYGPADYPDQGSWDSRYQIERSAAIKCPTILTQLSGVKKVQQVLATAGRLDRFVDESSEAGLSLRSTFANIYPMDATEAGLEARKLALDPERCKSYVLKPQREGGGNNVYKASIPSHLRSIPETHWGTFILMELITPPPLTNTILRGGKLERGGVICELGIYGACLWNHVSGEILRNEEAGYLLRTKGDQSEEGGVAAGFGCMDSCTLV